MPQAPNKCVRCGNHASTKCGKCKTAYYCSRECQRQDWERHSPLCEPISTTNDTISKTRSQLGPYTRETLKSFIKHIFFNDGPLFTVISAIALVYACTELKVPLICFLFPNILQAYADGSFPTLSDTYSVATFTFALPGTDYNDSIRTITSEPDNPLAPEDFAIVKFSIHALAVLPSKADKTIELREFVSFRITREGEAAVHSLAQAIAAELDIHGSIDIGKNGDWQVRNSTLCKVIPIPLTLPNPLTKSEFTYVVIALGANASLFRTVEILVDIMGDAQGIAVVEIVESTKGLCYRVYHGLPTSNVFALFIKKRKIDQKTAFEMSIGHVLYNLLVCTYDKDNNLLGRVLLERKRCDISLDTQTRTKILLLLSQGYQFYVTADGKRGLICTMQKSTIENDIALHPID